VHSTGGSGGARKAQWRVLQQMPDSLLPKEKDATREPQKGKPDATIFGPKVRRPGPLSASGARPMW